MKNFNIVDGKVLLATGNSVELAYPVAELIDFNSIAVIRLNVPIEETCNENVIAIDALGNLVWKIPSRKYVYENSPYMKIAKEDENVAAHNWDGQVLIISAKTGLIVDKRHTK